MRRAKANGVCACCGAEGMVWGNHCVPLDLGAGGVVEADTTLPDLCDTCDYAQQRWDARQHELRCFGAGYPYFDKPPISPPVRRPGDRELGPDGWPR